jgi:hypothetical protein
LRQDFIFSSQSNSHCLTFPNSRAEVDSFLISGTSSFLAGAVISMIVLAVYLVIAATLAATYYARLPTAAVSISLMSSVGHIRIHAT